MKILPIKLPDYLYAELKKAAKEANTTMTAIVRDGLTQQLKKQKKLIFEDSGKKTFTQLMSKHIYQGKIYHQDKTDDEILYGGDLGND